MLRRTFLQVSAAAVGGFAAMPHTLLGAPAAPPAVPARLGVQLYTLRSIFPNDFIGVLEMLHHYGYREVEFAGLHERSARDARQVLDSVGLTAPSAHVPLEALQNQFDATVQMAQTMGHQYVIVPWLAEDARRSVDDYRRVADLFNTLGQRLKGAGLRLAYHNHDFEFETFGGATPAYDVLLQETDPALVSMQMDLFWAVKAGHDPVAYFERFPGRFPLVHVKDRTAGGDMVDVGAGVIDFARIFAHSEQAGIRHAIVEHDNPKDPLATVEASYRHLQSIRGR